MTVAPVRRRKFARPLTIFLIALLIRPAVAIGNDVVPPAPAPPRPVIVGFVDTHLHQFANLGFGGLEVWGSPMDPMKDPSAPIATARARALPDSDFLYVSAADAPDYLDINGLPVTAPLAEMCDDGSCWAECPAGTGVPGNACVKITLHGPGGAADELNALIPHGSESGHGVLGYPDMNGWPAFDVHTAQQAYWEWLKRAHDNGMKLMVMLAVNNSVLCQLAIHRASFGCGDDGAVTRQIQGAKDLQTYIDARSGGPGLGFYRIVYSAEEARSAIQAGKLAVVLGTEVDASWGCTVNAAHCNDTWIQSRVQDYYNAGIRVVYPVHLVDNRFGGAAAYTSLFELENYLVNNKQWFDMAACGAPIEWRSDIRKIMSDAKLGVAGLIGAGILLGPGVIPLLELAVAGLTAGYPIIGRMITAVKSLLPEAAPLISLGGTGLVVAAAMFILESPGAILPADAGNCNIRTLTTEGATLINALIDRRMIIDVDHTDGPTFDAIMDIAEARSFPGIVSGHTGLVDANLTAAEIGPGFKASDSGRHEGNKTFDQVQRINNLGGFLSLGLTGGGRNAVRDFSGTDNIALNCGRSSEAFAQVYRHATQALGLTAVGFGSDINGFAGTPAPRYGLKACQGDFPAGYDVNRSTGRLDYATASNIYGAPLTQYTFGSRTWDFNTDGFANVGLFPDFIADLKAIGLSDEDLAPLLNAAEAYVRMWEKVDDDDTPTVRCGTVGEEWHAANVTVPCIAYDFGYGLANAADANFALSTTVAEGAETGDASTGTHAAVCDTASHCTDVIPAITGINVDRKDPSVMVNTPAAGTPTYLLNAVVNADYACADGGSGVKTCSAPVASGAPIDTTIGGHAFTVTGADNVDHTVVVPRPYNVTFQICVLYDETKAHKAGSTAPIKLSICDAAGNNVSSSSIVLTATGVTQLSTSAPGPLDDAGNANPDNNFRYDVALGGYIFNLKTTGLTTGTYGLSFMAPGDPIPHQVKFQVR